MYANATSFRNAHAVQVSPRRIFERPAVYPSEFPRATSRRPRVLSCSISGVRRDRDFGRIEAWVTLLYQDRPAKAPHARHILVNVPSGGANRSASIRNRLRDKAMRLAIMMPEGTRIPS